METGWLGKKSFVAAGGRLSGGVAALSISEHVIGSDAYD
jgi:hypothetical protein